MNNYTFNDDGKQYKRIDKRQAKKLYDAGKTIILCACNLRPFGFWRPEIPINKTTIYNTDTRRRRRIMILNASLIISNFTIAPTRKPANIARFIRNYER